MKKGYDFLDIYYKDENIIKKQNVEFLGMYKVESSILSSILYRIVNASIKIPNGAWYKKGTLIETDKHYFYFYRNYKYKNFIALFVISILMSGIYIYNIYKSQSLLIESLVAIFAIAGVFLLINMILDFSDQGSTLIFDKNNTKEVLNDENITLKSESNIIGDGLVFYLLDKKYPNYFRSSKAKKRNFKFKIKRS